MKSDTTFQHSRRPPWSYCMTLSVGLWTSLVLFSALLVLTSVDDTSANPLPEQRDVEEDDSESNREAASKKYGVCHTKTCKATAKRIKDNMDTTVNPCDNFYEFACGNYEKRTPIPGYRSSVDSFSDRQDQILKQMHSVIAQKATNPFLYVLQPKFVQLTQSLYQSCMNTAYIEYLGLKPMRPILARLGGWPVLSKPQLERSIDTTSYEQVWREAPLRYRKAGFGYASFISISFGIDLKNSTKQIIVIDKPPLDLPLTYLARGFDNPVVQAYYTYMVRIAEMFGASLPVAKADMKNVVAFEIELAKIQLQSKSTHNFNKFNNHMTISELYKRFPFVPWWEEIEKYLQPYWYLSSPEEVVLVRSPGYLEKLKDLIPHVPERVKANYVVWRFVSYIVPYLNEEARGLRFQFFSKLVGVKKPAPRWMTCTYMVLSRLPLASGAIYVERFFDRNSKTAVKKMLEDIKAELLLIMEALTWMKDNTRLRAIQKLEAMFTSVGYPEEIRDKAKVNEHYKKLNLLDYYYLENYFRLNEFSGRNLVANFGKQFDKKYWKNRADIVIVNAFYMPQFNSINIPAGILGGVFYNKDNPHYINYGGIAQVIGHELTHGFDDVGSQMDQNGNLNSWWDPKTLKAFKKKSQCIVDQYGNYTLKIKGSTLKINGKASIGENIADNGGIKEAYFAYNTWVQKNGKENILPGLDYTPKQLFWISAANMWCNKFTPEELKERILNDPHTPATYRVIGALSNRPEFAADFGCPAGSTMNPKKKCEVW